MVSPTTVSSLPFTSVFSSPVFTSCNNQPQQQQPIQSKPLLQTQQPAFKTIQQTSVSQPLIAQQQSTVVINQQQPLTPFMRHNSNQGNNVVTDLQRHSQQQQQQLQQQQHQQQQQQNDNTFSVLADWSPATTGTDDTDEINQAAQTLASMAASVSAVPSTGATWVPPPGGSTTDSGSDTTSPRPQILGQYGPGDNKKGECSVVVFTIHCYSLAASKKQGHVWWCSGIKLAKAKTVTIECSGGSRIFGGRVANWLSRNFLIRSSVT